jgi:hypothetical protein
MPKLWRAPMPMVRIAAPQITATQKLRCGGASLDSDDGRGVDEERDWEETDIAARTVVAGSEE